MRLARVHFILTAWVMAGAFGLLSLSAEAAMPLACPELFGAEQATALATAPKNNAPNALHLGEIRALRVNEVDLSAHVLRALPQAEFDEIQNLKRLSYQVANAVGLSKTETQHALYVFIDSGAIGGSLQTYALLGHQIRAIESKRLKKLKVYGREKISNNELNDEAQAMVDRVDKAAEQFVRVTGTIAEAPERKKRAELARLLQDPRMKTLLAVWYRGALPEMSRLAVVANPHALKSFVVVPFTSNDDLPMKLSMTSAITGFPAMAISLAMHSHIAPYATAFFAVNAAVSASYNGLIGRAQKSERKAVDRLVVSGASLAQLVRQPLGNERARQELPPLDAFQLENHFEPLTIPLRSALYHEKLRVEFYEAAEAPEGLFEPNVNLTALMKLTILTLKQQLERADQIDQLIIGLDGYLTRGTKTDFQELSKIRRATGNFYLHLRALEEDTSFALTELSKQIKTLRNMQTANVSLQDAATKKDVETLLADAEADLARFQQSAKTSFQETSEHLAVAKRKVGGR